MKATKLFSAIAILMACVMCFNMNVFAADVSGDSILAVAPAATTEYPEYTSGYDKVFVSGDNGWGQRGYQTGGLFNLWRSRSFTEVWGDHQLAVSAQVPYAYARIRNLNTGADYSSTENVMDSNRYCGAYTSYISPSYATHLYHTATLKINGVYNWSSTASKYNLPG